MALHLLIQGHLRLLFRNFAVQYNHYLLGLFSLMIVVQSFHYLVVTFIYGCFSQVPLARLLKESSKGYLTTDRLHYVRTFQRETIKFALCVLHCTCVQEHRHIAIL